MKFISTRGKSPAVTAAEAIRILMELGKGEKPAEQTEKADAAQPQVFR